MKTLTITTLLTITMTLTTTLASPQRPGTGINLRLSDIVREMRDKSEVERQVACIVGQGRCNERGRQLKNFIPSLSTGVRCFRCSRDEERKLKLIVSTLQTRYPVCWHVIVSVLERKMSPAPRVRGCA
ncbi:hypothetical protein E2C01_102627 [Portunus trituberculatus]|uniref:Chemosensory protein n=1 Tax=Portunus trituberculatus TaxID=210409 RepID=A0A5B7KN88_PORTR|nr:hypothetical protein [Portunus trituberculatus]